MARVSPTAVGKVRAARTDASIDTIAGEVNRKLGAGTMIRASAADRELAVRRLTTGSLGWDLALGGGWPVNKVSEVVGRESAGKTTAVYKTIAANQALNPDYTVLWVASEDFDFDRAETCGVDLGGIMLFEENVMELVLDKVVEVCRARAADMWVIDSYPQLITMKDDEQTLDGSTVSAAPKLVNYFMRQVVKAMKRSLTDRNDRAITGLFVNQWRSKITMFGDPRTTPGGEGKNYSFWTRVEVSRDEFIESPKEDPRGHLGQKINLHVFKNKQAPPRDSATVGYYFRDKDASGLIGAGDYDLPDELLNLGLVYDVIEKSSSSFSYGNITWRGKQAFAQAVLEEPALFAAIDADIRRAAVLAETPARRRRQLAPVEEEKSTTVRRRRRAG